MSTTIRTDDVRELLALVPFQLGFRPTESAVLVSLRGSRSRVGLVARLDLADLAGADGDQAARSFVGHVLADGARRAVAVIYTRADLQRVQDVATADPVERAARAAARALAAATRDAFGRTDTWVVGPRGWYALGCAEPVCCPPGGRPLRELESTRVSAQMVLEGVLVAASRDDLVRLPVTTPAERKAARRARDRWRVRGLTAHPGAEMHRWRRDGLELWRQAFAAALDERLGVAGPDVRSCGTASLAGVDEAHLSGGPAAGEGASLLVPGTDARDGALPAARAGRLMAALEDVLVRDAVLLSFVPGNDRVAERVVAGERGASVGRAIAAITDPTCGVRPDPDRAGAARTVLERLVAHATRGEHAPGLTLLAVLAWWEGDGARAGVLVDRALVADPDHRLAHLVDQALRAGMPPGWVRAGRAG